MGPTSRRIFLLQLAVTGSAALAVTPVPAPGPGAKLDEKDPTATALGYVAETSKADLKKYPKHANDQKCSGCALFQGKAGDAAGACPIFAGKQVAAGGWCSSWAKKP